MTERPLPRDCRKFIQALPEPGRAQVMQLRDALLAIRPELQEAIKWRRHTFTTVDNWHHWICAVGSSAGRPRLYFHKGALLHDPQGLLEGSGRYVRSLDVDAALRLERRSLQALVNEAVRRQTDMK